MGNAVSPQVASALGRCLARAALHESPPSAMLVSVPDPEYQQASVLRVDGCGLHACGLSLWPGGVLGSWRVRGHFRPGLPSPLTSSLPQLAPRCRLCQQFVADWEALFDADPIGVPAAFYALDLPEGVDLVRRRRWPCRYCGD